MKVIKIILLVLFLAVCLSTVFRGVTEFNIATSWLEVFRGLFRTTLGTVGFWTSITVFRESKK